MSGVSHIEVGADDAEMRLDRFLKKRFPQLTQGAVQKLLRTGQIRIDGKRAEANARLEAGQSIRIPPLPKADEDAPRETKAPAHDSRTKQKLKSMILYEDADVIVLDKPAGLPVQGGTGQSQHLDGMLEALAVKGERPHLVHRLDKDTSGVMIVARNAFSARALAQSFRRRDTRKYYWAVTVGVPTPLQGKIDAALAKQSGAHGERVAMDEEEGKRAVSLYSVVDHAAKRAAWVALWPMTGRTHQLRVHLAAIGTPILGDWKYGGPASRLTGGEVSTKLHLHARRLILPHPRSGTIDATAPLPTHMRATWETFGFAANDDGDPFAALD
jgi:23S rRNA pseudouridine955/2504/2580 synthase